MRRTQLITKSQHFLLMLMFTGYDGHMINNIQMFYLFKVLETSILKINQSIQCLPISKSLMYTWQRRESSSCYLRSRSIKSINHIIFLDNKGGPFIFRFWPGMNEMPNIYPCNSGIFYGYEHIYKITNTIQRLNLCRPACLFGTTHILTSSWPCLMKSRKSGRSIN